MGLSRREPEPERQVTYEESLYKMSKGHAGHCTCSSCSEIARINRGRSERDEGPPWC